MGLTSFAEKAEYYLPLGWKVYPVAIINGRKHPLPKHGVHDASGDPEQIAEWSRRWPAANIAVATGKASGLVVLDIDGAQGEKSFEALNRACGVCSPLPESGPIALSGRGRHYYFRSLGGTVKNMVSSRLGPGIDIRGDGGGIWAPPSIHETGVQYEWMQDPYCSKLPLFPWKLFQVVSERMTFDVERARFIEKPRVAPISQRALANLRERAPSVERAIDRVLSAPQGQRNHTLNSAALTCGRAVAMGAASEAEVTQMPAPRSSAHWLAHV